jgi:HPt (histidine-containing phosphotransfer) domain-containing protein
MNNDRLLDLPKTIERLGDEMMISVVARVFIRTAPALLDSLAAALTANDLKRAVMDSHSLKGAVAAFEAPVVFNNVASIERHAKAGDAKAAATALAEARPLVERLLSELAVKAAA